MAEMPDEHYNRAVADTSLIACPHCDLLQRLYDLGSAARRDAPLQSRTMAAARQLLRQCSTSWRTRCQCWG